MKNDAIKIVPLAVGRDVLLEELRKMATNPLDVDLVRMEELATRPDLVQELQQKLCHIPRE